MTAPASTRADRATATGLGRSRTRVLDALEAADGSLTVAAVAEQVGLHPNTTRFHLDALVEAGLASRSDEGRDQPGRPRALYAATPDSAGMGRRSYLLLAEILAAHFAAHTRRPAESATAAGRAYGRHLTRPPAPFTRVNAADATRQVVQVLSDIGFMPEPVTAGRQRRIELHHCPFREIAASHGQVVCSLHLGLMQGMLAEIGAPLVADRLEPFARPSVCVVHLAASAPGQN